MINSLGFTGSSDFGMPTAKQKQYLTKFMLQHAPKHVHHGDCVNSDAEFHKIAKYYQKLSGRPIIHVHPPSNPKKRAFCEGDVMYAEQPYLKRNHNIVNMADVLLATPNKPDPGENTRGSGTWTTIKYAKQKGIAIHIVYPDGKFDIVPSATSVANKGDAL